MATRRMNEVWRRMALALVLCVLLFHSCHADDAEDPVDQTNPTDAAVPSTEAPGASHITGTSQTDLTGSTEQGSSATGATAKPIGDGSIHVVSSTDEILKMFDVGDASNPVKLDAAPTPQVKKVEVRCVQKEDIIDRGAVKVELQNASTCENTLQTIMSQMKDLCDKPSCSFEIFQEENTKDVIVTGKSIEGDVTGMTDRFTSFKEPLGVAAASAEHGKSSPAVFVSLLVTGLIVAAALIGAYLWKNNRRTNSKGMKLANDSVMADEENQGNTLVSVAPLNPPEPQEKPSLNGESPEAVKTQNPPAATNGHSTTKTADTEL